jgi:hypothetical protein
MTEPTKEEKYKFSGYYKFIFTFKSSSGKYISIGGDADDIYRLDIETDKEYTGKELSQYIR